MKIGIMQPYFFPYLGYWQLINAVDKYVVYDDVAYIKRGWINRNNILLNANKHLLTLPLEGASQFKAINEIPITSQESVRKKIIRTLMAAYNKAPHYDEIMPMLENLIMKSIMISQLNLDAIKMITEYIGINTEIILSSELIKNNELRGQNKIIHICKLLKGDKYINAIGGQELYSADEFKNENIELYFLRMNHIEYDQYAETFIPGLSIIDLLMFNSKERIVQMLNEYSLIPGK